VFLFLLLRRRPRNDPDHQRHVKGSETNELEERFAGSLAEPVSSVTEHTTRAFDAIPRERS
jgi:hypothetical protein